MMLPTYFYPYCCSRRRVVVLVLDVVVEIARPEGGCHADGDTAQVTVSLPLWLAGR